MRLQEKPLRVLAALAEQQGQVVTRDELKKRLWPEDTFVDFETGLNTAVSKLRDTLSDDVEKPRYIETIPRRGYRFLASVEFVNEALPHTGNGEASIPLLPPSQCAEPAAAKTLVAEPFETPRRKSTSRARLWVGIAGALVVVAGVAFWLMHGRPAFSFRPRDSVLIADFENQTGDPRFDNALATAFTVSIEQSRYANVFPRTRVDSVLQRMEKPLNERITPALGREICERENIRGLIVNSITRTGQEYALTAQLIDPQSGETVRSFTERSAGEDHVLQALEALSKEIREALGESLYDIHMANKPLPQVTTSSLNALQQYAQGSSLWRRGKYQEAGAMFKAAVAADPDFAMAHAELGNAYYSYIYSHPEDGQKEYQKALSLVSRSTDRERMIIETQFAANQNHVGDASMLFRAYLNRYPDDAVMRFDYANLLRRAGRQQDAIEQYTQALRMMPDYAHAYLGIATAYKSLGKYTDALQAYGRAFELDPQFLTSGNVNREYGFALVANGEDQKADQIFSALLGNPQTRETGLRSLAFLDLYHGRYASAGSRLKQSLDLLRGQRSPLSEARVHLLLAIVAEGTGNAKAIKQNLDDAASCLDKIQAKVVFGAMLGDEFAREGFAQKAEQIAAVIAPLADQQSSQQMGYLHLLEGEIVLATGKNEKAVELLTLADKENSTGYSIEALARSYQQSGNIDKAISAYERIFSDPDPAFGWEPQQRWLQARYVLATDYAARGEKQKARETLAALLGLWKAADPGLTLLREAKAEYSELQ